MHTTKWLVLALIGGALATGACGSSPATRFYMLDSTLEKSEASLSLVVGLGPIRLPPYIDRDPIVTRSGATTLEFAEFDRWAEPLQDGVERVLMQDLAAALGSSSVESHPWGLVDIDIRVPVQVLRFDNDESGTATLVARWSIEDNNHNVVSPARTSTVTVPSASGGFADTTNALGRSLGRLATEMATEIRQGPSGRSSD